MFGPGYMYMGESTMLHALTYKQHENLLHNNIICPPLCSVKVEYECHAQ